MSLNKTFLIGRLTRDPEVRSLPGGQIICKFCVAVDGYKKGETDFIDCTAWNKTAEFVGNWFNKGKLILVEGRLKLEKWTDKDSGKERSRLGVVAEKASFAGDRESTDNRGGNGRQSYADRKAGDQPPSDYAPPTDPPPSRQDDLPF